MGNKAEKVDEPPCIIRLCFLFPRKTETQPFVARGRMAPLQTQMAKTEASAAGLTGSLPTAEARSDLASETLIEPRMEFRLPLFWPPSAKRRGRSLPKNH